MTQAEFKEHIETWWEDHYEEQFGNYDSFWQDPEDWYFDNMGAGEDWDDFWENIGEFFDELGSDLGEFFDNVGHFFGDKWDDFWERDVRCPDVFNGDPHIESRTIICNWYYINDCPQNSYAWWTFPDGYSDAAVFNDRLANYWEAELQGKIEYSDLRVIAEDCDPWSSDFEACVAHEYSIARRAALSDIINNNDITEYDLNELDQLTQNCNYSNDFEYCVLDTYYTDTEGGLDYGTQGATWENHSQIYSK